MKIRNKGNFSTSIVLGWMFFLAVFFVVLVFSGSSKASELNAFPVLSQGFGNKLVKTSVDLPAKYACGEMQVARVKYTLREKQTKLLKNRYGSSGNYSDGPVLFTLELPEPWVTSYKDGSLQFVPQGNPFTLMLFGLNHDSISLGYGQSFSTPVFYTPPC